MFLSRTTLFTLAGAAAGVVVVHPYVMLVDRLTGSGHSATAVPMPVGSLFTAFAPAMLHMTIAIGFFAGLCGLLLGLLYERKQRMIRYRYQARMHRDLTRALNQLLGVVSHYILNSSMVISAHARRLEKTAHPEDQESLTAIARQAEKNEAVLKLMQEAEFLRNIDPSDTTYQKLIELNERIEQHLRDNSNPKNL